MKPTYFARHSEKLDIDPPTRRALWDERRIAIHFPYLALGASKSDAKSIDPVAYSGSARRAMRALAALAKSGGYVCAQYSGINSVLVGEVRANSQIEIVRGKWGDISGNTGRTALLKTLRLRRVREVSMLQSVPVLAGRPRQGTLMRWPRAGSAIAQLVEGTKGKLSIANLLPAQQEVLCSELLRLPEMAAMGLPIMTQLLMPVGRTMKDIDILGLASDGRRIAVQVTFGAAKWKLERLRPFVSDDCHVILFCEAPTVTESDGITIVPLKTAFDVFRATPAGRRWLKHTTAP